MASLTRLKDNHNTPLKLVPNSDTSTQIKTPLTMERNKNLPFVYDYTMKKPNDQKSLDTLLYDIVAHERKTMNPNGKLYVIIGENHSKISHDITQANLLENIKTKMPDQKLGLAMECTTEYNQASTIGEDFVKIESILSLLLKDYEILPEKEEQFSALVKSHVEQFNQKALDVPEATARRLNIHVNYVDNESARNNLDHAISQQGMKERNQTMSSNIIENSKNKNLDITVAWVGQNHLQGAKINNKSCIQMVGNYPFEESLSHYMAQEIEPNDKIIRVLLDKIKYFDNEKVLNSPQADFLNSTSPLVIIRNYDPILKDRNINIEDLKKSYGASPPKTMTEDINNQKYLGRYTKNIVKESIENIVKESIEKNWVTLNKIDNTNSPEEKLKEQQPTYTPVRAPAMTP